jgi:hypothetical protein
MNTLVSTVYRDLSCFAGAVLITFVVASSFVQSTAVPPGTRPAGMHITALRADHAWFGQPEPAVLVD